MADSKFHIVMFPWFAAGHMTPFLYLANELAKRGYKITYLSPKKAEIQLGHLNRHPDLIAFRLVTIPHVAGLPEGTETASEIPLSLNHLLCAAIDLIQDQVLDILREIKPEMVLYDNAFWLPELARKLGIKSVCFNVVCAASLAIGVVPARKVPKDRALTLEEVRQPPPGYPSTKVVLRGDEARSLLFLSLPFGGNITFYDRITTALRECDAIAIRTCSEIERSFCDYMSLQYNKPVFLTGPVLPQQPKEQQLDHSIATWLAGFEPRSVVFCAFGSQLNLEKHQYQEILLGFELTGFPFLIYLKPPVGCETVDEALPERFEERVGRRGMVCRGWVQQPLILDHPTVGCFVNHCGFGSMWESLMSEKQIVLCPHLGDQILNTRVLVEELEAAVEVEKAEENGWISKEKLCEAVKKVMDEESEVGKKVRKNHEEWRRVLGSSGFMDDYIDGFVQNLRGLLRLKND